MSKRDSRAQRGSRGAGKFAGAAGGHCRAGLPTTPLARPKVSSSPRGKKGLASMRETFGQASGEVGRPRHNKRSSRHNKRFSPQQEFSPQQGETEPQQGGRE